MDHLSRLGEFLIVFFSLEISSLSKKCDRSILCKMNRTNRRRRREETKIDGSATLEKIWYKDTKIDRREGKEREKKVMPNNW